MHLRLASYPGCVLHSCDPGDPGNATKTVGGTGYPGCVDELWVKRRSGSYSGRGFHYQDAVATELAVRAWCGELALARLIPEGLEDVSLELDAHALHLQAKSRRSHRGNFSDSELAGAWRHLAECVLADPDARVGLVLERPLGGADTGLEQTLADVAHERLKRAVATAVAEIVAPDEFLARAHVLVMPAAPATAVALLAERLGVPPASCLAHYEILRGRVAQLADENGKRSADHPAALTAADIARVIDEISESVDPSLLDEAVHTGAVELVDFTTPLDEPRFYSGVDVVPGHVVAGLPLERNELIAELEQGVDARGVALAIGPSGSGKSALIWLAAFATRHRVRWYRVRRLSDDDVAAVVRLVNALHPVGARVGFVVDDLGRDDRLGFDALVDELRHQPEVAVLGACREEDLFLVRSATGAAQVRPALDEHLAERIWRELRDGGETSWPEWREPFEASDGLLLEFGHLLTEGTRLAETITSQVDRRVREHRSLELELLALVATADAYGAELQLERVKPALDADDAAIKLALIRLVDEHLIRERDGDLAGLHELRSRHISRAIHSMPPPTFAETVRRLIDLLDGDALQRFQTRLLLDNAVADDVVIDAVAARVEREPDARAVAASLQALRLVGFRRMSAQWREIFADEGAAPTNVALVAHFALHGGDDELFPEPIQRAVARIRALEPPDPRPALVDNVAPHLSAILAAPADVAAATELLAALAGLTAEVDAADVACIAREAPLDDLRLLLEAAHLVSPELATGVVGALGGATELLARLECERPWVRHARVGTTSDGRPAAFADYAFVAESVQSDPHGAVVELARYVFALMPAAEVAVCRAVDARGQLAGFGDFAIADKAIERRYLPSAAEVAWNRARGRAATAAVAAASETDYLRAASEIIVDAERLARRAGDCWVRGKRPSKQLVAAAVALAEASNRLTPPPVVIDSVDGLGDDGISDPVSFLGTMIANNLFPNLLGGRRVAPLIPQLIEQVDKVATTEYWRLLGQPPLSELAELREGFVDLHAVVAEAAREERPALVALRAAGKGGVTAAARVARQRAETRMKATASRVEQELEKAGFAATVRRRAGAPQSHRWPSDDFLVLVDVPTIFAWQQSIDGLTDVCRPLLEDRIGFLIAPVRDGRVVASFGVKVLTNVFPAAEEVGEWAEISLLDECLGELMRRGFAGVDEASSIIASLTGDVLHDDEAAALEAAFAHAREALQELDGLNSAGGDQLLLEVEATLVDTFRAVEDELKAVADGNPVPRGVAAAMLDSLNGSPDDDFVARIVTAAACVEWDVDADGAWDRVCEALELTSGP